MLITRDKAIEMLKQGRLLCEEQWGGYRYSIDNLTVRFDTVRKLMKEGLVVLDKTKDNSPLLKWYKWGVDL